MLACPSQSWTKRKSAPASSRWVAMECLRQWKCRLEGGRPAASPYFFISQSSVRRAIGSPRLLGNSTGEGGCSPSRSQARIALASSGCDGCVPERLPLSRCTVSRSVRRSRVVRAQQAHLAGAQPVAVGEKEQG